VHVEGARGGHSEGLLFLLLFPISLLSLQHSLLALLLLAGGYLLGRRRATIVVLLQPLAHLFLH